VHDSIKPGAAFYVWYASREHINFETALNEVGLQVREQLIWVKNTLVLSRQDYHWRHEPCLYGWKEGAAHNWYNDRKQTTVLEFNRPTANREHPTMKPVELIAYQIENSSKGGDLVFDPFGGSGTTLMACEQLDRKCYTMELDPKYCDVIVKRWEALTGKQAKRSNKQ
jgi:site-specific DNA-methyltransferase (adenine-specific)